MRTGSVLPATVIRSSSRTSTSSCARRSVSSAMITRVPYILLMPSSREARLTVSPITVKDLETGEPIVPTITSPVAMRRRGVFGKSSGGYGGITHALRQSDIWAAAACHSGDMGFELCYLTCQLSCARSPAPRTPSSAGGSNSKPPKSIRRVPAESSTRWRWRPAMIPIPRSSSGSPVTFDICEVIEERCGPRPPRARLHR